MCILNKAEKSVAESLTAFQEDIMNGVKKQKERIIGFFTILLCIAKFTEVMTSTL